MHCEKILSDLHRFKPGALAATLAVPAWHVHDDDDLSMVLFQRTSAKIMMISASLNISIKGFSDSQAISVHPCAFGCRIACTTPQNPLPRRI